MNYETALKNFDYTHPQTHLKTIGSLHNYQLSSVIYHLPILFPQ